MNILNSKIIELISRRRRQILVHSCIYYELDDNIISDSQWSEWALELENLQRDYPEEAKKAAWGEAFKDFDHSTGQNLREYCRYPQILNTAYYLLKTRH